MYVFSELLSLLKASQNFGLEREWVCAGQLVFMKSTLGGIWLLSLKFLKSCSCGWLKQVPQPQLAKLLLAGTPAQPCLLSRYYLNTTQIYNKG